MQFMSKARTFLYGHIVGLLAAYYRHVWGMRIGKGVRISLSAKLDKTNPKGIVIGDYSAVTFGSAVMSHDITTLKHSTTTIGTHCLIGAHAIILPGVTIGDHCIIGAGSVVMTNIPSNSLAMGNPARVIERNIRTISYGIRQEAYDRRVQEERERRERDGRAEAKAPETLEFRPARSTVLGHFPGRGRHHAA